MNVKAIVRAEVPTNDIRVTSRQLKDWRALERCVAGRLGVERRLMIALLRDWIFWEI